MDEGKLPFGPAVRRARNRPGGHVPPPGALEAGQLYFSDGIWTRMSVRQQIKLGARNVGSRNKSFKARPWLVVKVGEGDEEGRVWVMYVTLFSISVDRFPSAWLCNLDTR
jgi:hypothetical protein